MQNAKMIPLKKQSKKNQREFHAMKRSSWMLNPVTRTVESRKAYDRGREKRVCAAARDYQD